MTDATRISAVRSPTAVRIARRAQQLRLAVGALVVVCMVAAPGLAPWQRLAFAGIGVWFLAFAVIVARFVVPTRPQLAQRLFVANSAAAVFLGALVVPELILVMGLIALASVVAVALINNRRDALWFAGVWVSAGVVANAIGGDRSPFNWFAILMWAIAVVGLPIAVDALTQERRRVSDNLMRLHRAMRTMTATPDLTGTLDSVAESVGQAIGATATGILLRRDDHLVLAAPLFDERPWTEEQIEKYTRRELNVEGGSPISVAMATGDPVVVRDPKTDTRFPVWAQSWSKFMSQYGLYSIAVVPLCLGDDVIGLLVANFGWVGAIDDDELAILEAYAEQAALLVARAQAYEQQREAAERLAEADRLKSEFLAMVSHELRTPLTAAKGFVDTVLLHWDKLDDDRRKELLERASKNAGDLTRLIGQLLDFSKIDADRVEIRPRPVAMLDLVDRIVGDLAPVLVEHDIVIDVDPQVRVVADPDAVGHVIVNLLSNAVKFSPAGSAITVRARTEGDVVELSVADRGVGIPPDDVQRVFERFYQSEQPWSSRRGTGIGLAIARRFVELHGGRIWAESTVGEGSTFFFTVPAEASAATPPAPPTPPATTRHDGERAAEADQVRPDKPASDASSRTSTV